MNNSALARFITSLGSLNNYGSTVLQTKKALDLKSTSPLNQDNDDAAIFSDALKGIKAIKKNGFNTDGIISINAQFNTPSKEQPSMPGHLRNAYYNEDDRIAIVVGNGALETYIPPEVISRKDIDKIVDEFYRSRRRENDAWLVFAKLSKLQPFQDGNKRTALIAANAAINTFKKEDYLVLPFNDLDRAEFTINLMRFYVAKSDKEETAAFKKMLSVLPSKKDRLFLLKQPVENEDRKLTKTIKLKPQFRDTRK
ncbi:MAG TPA: Fic family protein [Candidatus Enterococcus stercoravium]|nr:Fic family protein [Candidatus Enterococcus stercoravium]